VIRPEGAGKQVQGLYSELLQDKDFRVTHLEIPDMRAL
jgi:hypothetical protein